MANDFRRGIRIYLETSDFGKGIDEMAKKTKEYENELENLVKQSDDLTAAGKNTGTEWNKLQKQIKNKTGQLQKATTAEAKYKQQLGETNKVLNNLSGATHNQLIKVRNQLRKEMRDGVRDSKEYKAAKEQLLRVEKELAKAHQDLTSRIGCQNNMFGRASGTINKYAGLLGAAASAVFGANFAFRRLAEEAARMDDVYSDVIKTTGMTRDQVLELNEVFKQMDTRTAREELNRLAYDAGKLGLTAREDILGFVEAGNQIRVALGQELGDDAIKSIGKMSGIFRHSTRELQGLNLRDMMLSTASAINELGMSSTANEQYMVQFAGRLGGVASQANIGMGSILGFASTLDQNMQKVEMAATALQKFILRTMSDPAEMARIAGLEVREFTELLSRDTNAAILQVLRALNEKGGIQQLIPIFDEMGLSGARAVGVLSALSKNVDEIEKQQQIANRAMAEGTSVTNEYSIKNNNLQAQLEKSRKEFREVSYELGKSLLPILLKSTDGMTEFLRILVGIPKWLLENRNLMFSLITALITYYAITKSITVAEKARIKIQAIKRTGLQLKIALTNKATVAEKRLLAAQLKSNAAMLKSPWGIIAAAIVFAISLLIRWLRKKVEVTRAQEIHNGIVNRQNELIKENSAGIKQNRAELTSLVTAITRTNDNTELRSNLIDKLNQKYPEFLRNISREQITNEFLYAALANVNRQYSIQLKNRAFLAKAQAHEDATVQAMQRQIEIRQEIVKLHNTSTENMSERGRKRHNERISQLEAEYTLLNQNIDSYKAKSAEFRAEAQKNNSRLQAMNTSDYHLEQIRVWEESVENFQNRWKNALDRGREDEAKFYEEQVNKVKSLINFHKLKHAELKKLEERNNDNDGGPAFSPNAAEDPNAKRQQQAIANLLRNQRVLLDIERHAHTLRLKENELFEVDMTSLTAEQLNKRLELEELHYQNLDRIARQSEAARFNQAKVDIGVFTDASPEASGLTGDRLRAYEILYAQHQANLASIEADGIKRRTDFERNNNNIRLKALSDARDAMLHAEDAHQQALLISFQEGVINRTKTQAEFNQLSAELEATGMARRLEILISYRDMLLDVEGEMSDEQIKALDEANRAVEVAERSIRERKLNDEIKFQNDRQAIIQQFGLQNIADLHRMEMDALREAYEQKLLSEEEFQKARRAIRIRYAQEYVQTAQVFTNSVADAVGSIEQALTARISAEYAERLSDLIQLHESGVISQEQFNEQKAQLDYEQRVEELEIQKKYADANFALQVSQIVATTAVAAMQAFSALAGIPIVGPALGAAAAIAVGVTGAAQIAAAKAERDRVKSLTIERPGSSSSASPEVATSQPTGARVPITTNQAADGRWDVIGAQDGRTYRNVPYRGVMRTGIVATPTLVGERGSEVVIDHPTLRNLQMNAPGVIDTIMRHRVEQRANGNYTPISNTSGGQSAVDFAGIDQATIEKLIETLEKNEYLLDRLANSPLMAYVVLSQLEAKQNLRNKSKQRGSLR